MRANVDKVCEGFDIKIKNYWKAQLHIKYRPYKMFSSNTNDLNDTNNLKCTCNKQGDMVSAAPCADPTSPPSEPSQSQKACVQGPWFIQAGGW